MDKKYIANWKQLLFSLLILINIPNLGHAQNINILQSGPYCGGYGDCVGDVDIQFEIGDIGTVTSIDWLVLLDGRTEPQEDNFGMLQVDENGIYSITRYYPIGTHQLIFSIETDSGLFEEKIDFSINDCQVPIAVCISNLSTDINSSGEVELWAADLDSGSFDNCSSVTLTFADPRIHPDSISRTFRCEDGEIGMVNVELWAQDAAGNVNSCFTFLYLQSNFICGQNYSSLPSGNIRTTQDNPIPFVTVNLEGDQSYTNITFDDGQYHLPQFAEGGNYTITPSRIDDPLNGLSTFDLVLISRYILGTGTLDSGYERIAADIDNSGTITFRDLVELRALILGVFPDFLDNNSWRFVPSAFQFSNTSAYNVPDYTESIVIEDFEGDQSLIDLNFIGIKIGDVNGSAVTNFNETVEERSKNTTFTFQTDDQVLKAGETTTLSLRGDLASIDGLQFTIQHKNLELVEIIEEAATKANFGIFENYITASWVNNNATSDFVKFVFQAKQDVRLSEAIQLNSSRLEAETYAKNGAFQNIELQFVQADFALYQNAPNPFREETAIRFSLPNAQNAELIISDVNGKVLKVIAQNFAKGQHEIILDTQNFQAGILSYTLVTDNFSASKKMILMK